MAIWYSTRPRFIRLTGQRLQFRRSRPGKKQEVVSGFTSKPINSFICSYTGKDDMGDAEKYMESMHAYSSGTKGISLQMMSVADSFSVDFLQNFPDRKYVDAFLREAGMLGLKADCSEMIPYTTPKDHIFNTNFVKSLIGFFSGSPFVR